MNPVLAVTRTTMTEILRGRQALVLALLVVGSSAVAAHLASYGISLRDRLQLAASYGVGLPLFIVASGTIVLAAGAVARDVESRRIQTVVTKPCASWQLALGKLLAILAVDGALLVLGLALFTASVLSVLGGSADESERAVAMERFFTPRIASRPEARLPSDEEVRRLAQKLRTPTEARSSESAADLEGRARKILRLVLLRPGESARLEFPLSEVSERSVAGGWVLRYVLRWSPPGGTPQADCDWRLTDAGGASRFEARERVSGDVPHELSLPALPGGPVTITVTNPAQGDGARSLVIDPDEVEILTPFGGFWTGVGRALGIALAQLGLLAGVGLLGSAAFTFPTALLAGFSTYLVGMSSGFLVETFAVESSGQPRDLFERLAAWISEAGRWLMRFFPDIGGLEIVDRIAAGRAFTAGDLAMDAGLGCLGTALTVGVASWILSRRELASGRNT